MRLNDCSLFQRLKQLTKRQVDLNFEQLVQRYQAKQKEQEDLAFRAKYVQISMYYVPLFSTFKGEAGRSLEVPLSLNLKHTGLL